jgi:hypothetical protein|tara:strand:- start:17 stop:643 length:627 start_codon:yes stop_codon:yes gene_type:complete
MFEVESNPMEDTDQKLLLLSNHYHQQLDGMNKLLNNINEGGKNYPEFTPNLEDIKSFIEYFNFATIIHLDLLALLRAFYNAKNEWEKLFFAKSQILLLFESIKALKQARNKVNETILKYYKEHLPEHRNVTKLLKQFQNRISKYKDIRNNIIGHINPSYSLNRKLIDSLDTNEILNLAVSFQSHLMLHIKLCDTIGDILVSKVNKLNS